MIGLIIFGTRGVTYGSGNGKFYCPQCAGEQRYRTRRVRRCFTLYFIPVLPLDLLGEYVECGRCKGTFVPEVLNIDPGASQEEFEAEFQKAIKRVMVMMMLADGVIDDEEVTAIAEIYSQISGKPLTEERVRKEIAIAERDKKDVIEYVAGVAPSLNTNGKELVIKAALAVAAADGVFQEEEKQLLADIAATLDMSAAHVRGLLAEMAD